MKRYIIVLFGLLIINAGCKKFVDIAPAPNQIMNYKVFENDATATKAITGIYVQMIASGNIFTAGTTTYYAGMASDEMNYFFNDTKQEFVKNEISTNNHDLLSVSFWNPAYKFIFTANSCIEGLEKSNGLSPNVKNSLLGEAKFIRAFCYFYLVNLFGEVPLITSTDYEASSIASRTSVEDVYKQIILDLIDSKRLLPETYLHPDKIRPNKWTAAALLARVYLYNKEYENAFVESNAVIESGFYALQSNINNVFKKSSPETIFQLQPGTNNINTWEGSAFIPATPGVQPAYFLTDNLINQFEVGDERFPNWVGKSSFAGRDYYYPNKYKIQTSTSVTENYILLRFSEQYLIRAEALAHKNDFQSAIEDVNIIRDRAGLDNVSSLTKEEIIESIIQERRIEFFAEWGHRWLDLKRLNIATNVLSQLKPQTWQPTDTLWPIPNNQISLNPSLIQNPGY